MKRFGVYIHEGCGPSDRPTLTVVEVPGRITDDRDQAAWAWCEAQDPGGLRGSPTVMDFPLERSPDLGIWDGDDAVYDLSVAQDQWDYLVEDLAHDWEER